MEHTFRSHMILTDCEVRFPEIRVGHVDFGTCPCGKPATQRSALRQHGTLTEIAGSAVGLAAMCDDCAGLIGHALAESAMTVQGEKMETELPTELRLRAGIYCPV